MASSEKQEALFIEVADSFQIIDSVSAKVTFSIMGELIKSADKAFESGHYLESSIIMFQLVEYFQRLVLDCFAKTNRLSEDVIEKLKGERRFFNMVVFLGLVKPNNAISQRLFKFNAKRNDIVHDIFKFKTMESLNDELRAFYEEGLELIEGLRSLIPIKWSELI